MAALDLLRAIVFVSALLFFFQFTESAKTQKNPKALVTPITKDSKTILYTIELFQRTPLKKLHLVLDTTRDYTTVRCDGGSYVSSSYAAVPCSDATCKGYAYAGCGTCYGSEKSPGCNNVTCAVPGTGSSSIELARDVITLRATQGSNPGGYIKIPGVVFACATGTFLQPTAGMTASTLALPAQLASNLKLARKFAMCLPSTSASKGVLFFGSGPYVFLPPPGRDRSTGLVSTSLLKNPSYTDDLYVGLTAIHVNGVHVAIDGSKLAITSSGRGGTKLNTLAPYTQIATSVYTSLVKVFDDVAKKMNVSKVGAVEPFGACYSTKGVGSTRVGPAVPTIDLVFQNNATYWRIFGANSMVEVSQTVMCLGFVDGGEDPVTTVVIGTHQMQDNLLVVDFATSTLSFSSSLLFQQTTCSNFNFTSST